MARLAKSRAQKADVKKYGMMNTGTAGTPQAHSSKMADGMTRVKTGGVGSHAVKGTGKPSHGKSKMSKARVSAGHTAKY